jgi:hypothetical protein
MKTAMYIITGIILLTSFGCEKESTKPNQVISIEDLLVKNNEITGWAYAGSGWVANNISELTIYINGLADIFQRHGFVEAAHQQYQGKVDNNDCLLKLTIYNQGNESNALAVFEDPDLGLSGALNWDNGAGQAAHYVRYGGLSQVLTFYNGSYFVHLEINYDTEESLNIVKQFALNVDGKIE